MKVQNSGTLDRQKVKKKRKRENMGVVNLHGENERVDINKRSRRRDLLKEKMVGKENIQYLHS